jgi:uncharacterized ion transporter superfamily protein YfcC
VAQKPVLIVFRTILFFPANGEPYPALQVALRWQLRSEVFKIISHLAHVIITMLLSRQSCGQALLRLPHMVPINEFLKNNRLFQTRDLISCEQTFTIIRLR